MKKLCCKVYQYIMNVSCLNLLCLFCLITGVTSENSGQNSEQCVFVDPTTPRTVQEGVKAEFQCKSKNMPSVLRIWIEMDEQRFEPTSGTPFDKKFEIDLNRTDNRHSVACACENQHNTTKYSDHIVLNVQFISTDIWMKYHAHDVIESAKVTLSCTTSSSNPPSQIRWYEKGTLQPNNHDPDYEDGEYYGQKTSQRYTISGYHRHERPEVSCCIDRTKTTCRNWTAHVEYGPSKPTIRQDPDSIPKEGDDITLTCSDAYPTPDNFISWFHGESQKKGIPMGNHSELYIQSISEDDAGPYHCEANNRIGEPKKSNILALQVYYSPDISSLKYTCSNGGKSITLQCIAQSLPNPVFQWFSPNGNEITDAVNQRVVANDTFLGTKIQSNLTISFESSSITLGNFTCNASNVISKNAKAIFVSDDSCFASSSNIVEIVASVGGVLVVIVLFIIGLVIYRHRRQDDRQLDRDGQDGADNQDGDDDQVGGDDQERRPLIDNNEPGDNRQLDRGGQDGADNQDGDVDQVSGDDQERRPLIDNNEPGDDRQLDRDGQNGADNQDGDVDQVSGEDQEHRPLIDNNEPGGDVQNNGPVRGAFVNGLNQNPDVELVNPVDEENVSFHDCQS